MHHDKTKKVLSIWIDAGAIAEKTAIKENMVTELIESVKDKLLKEREKRKAPFIDKTLYTSCNGMMISSYLKAYRVLRENSLKEFALKSLKRILKNNLVKEELYHTEGVKAVLDDYVFIIEALITAYEFTGDSNYCNLADRLMLKCIEKFWDNKEGGFFDTDEEVLGIRMKEIEDIPHPSANALSIILLLKLYYMNEKQSYYQLAERTLRSFSSKVKNTGILSGYYFCALDAYFNMIKLSLETSPESNLSEIALLTYNPYISIVHGKDRGYVTPCFKNVCYKQIDSPETLRSILQNPGNFLKNVL